MASSLSSKTSPHPTNRLSLSEVVPLCEQKLSSGRFDSTKPVCGRIDALYRECFGPKVVTDMALMERAEGIAEYLGIAVDVPVDVAPEAESPPPGPPPAKKTKVVPDVNKSGLFAFGITVTTKDGETITNRPSKKQKQSLKCPFCLRCFSNDQGRTSHVRNNHPKTKDVLVQRLDEFFSDFNISKQLKGLMIDDGNNDDDFYAGTEDGDVEGVVEDDTQGGVEGLTASGLLKKDGRRYNRGALRRKTYSFMFKAKIIFLIEELWKDPIAQAHSVNDIVTGRTGISRVLQFKWMKLKKTILDHAGEETTKALKKMKRLRVSTGYFPLAERRVYKLFIKRRVEKRKVTAVFFHLIIYIYIFSVDLKFFSTDELGFRSLAPSKNEACS